MLFLILDKAFDGMHKFCSGEEVKEERGEAKFHISQYMDASLLLKKRLYTKTKYNRTTHTQIYDNNNAFAIEANIDKCNPFTQVKRSH